MSPIKDIINMPIIIHGTTKEKVTLFLIQYIIKREEKMSKGKVLVPEDSKTKAISVKSPYMYFICFVLRQRKTKDPKKMMIVGKNNIRY